MKKMNELNDEKSMLSRRRFLARASLFGGAVMLPQLAMPVSARPVPVIAGASTMACCWPTKTSLSRRRSPRRWP